MLRLALRSAVLSLLSLISVSALPCFGISTNFNQTYPLQPGGTFELQNVNGRVEVQGWDRNEVEIRAVKTATQKESDLERVSIEVNAKPDSISVTTRYPQNEGVEVAVEYSVHLPYSARIGHIGTVNGTLRVAGVDVIEDLRTVNGNIEVYDGGGTVRARTTNGNVHLELAHFSDQQSTTAETTNGSVLLAVPSDTQADLEARCLNGSFSSELPLVMQETLGPREMHAKLGKGGFPLRLHTVNGGIRVIALRPTV